MKNTKEDERIDAVMNDGTWTISVHPILCKSNLLWCLKQCYSGCYRDINYKQSIVD